MQHFVTAGSARGPIGTSRRPMRLPYGILVGPFVGGAALTLLVAAGTRQPITPMWVLAAMLVGAVAATFAFASTLWRHEPHVIAGARARAAAAVVPGLPVEESRLEAADPLAADGQEPLVAADAAADLAPEGTSAPEPAPRADDPLAHFHVVEDQGRRLRRDCVNCGTPVPLSADACPSCGQPQVYQCKGCQTPIRLEWTQCPECGREIH